MKKFKQFLEELELQEGTGLSADDMVGQKDSDDEGTTLKPRSKGEEDSKNKHMVTKTDYYAAPGQDHVFNGSIKEEVEDEELSEEEKLAFDLEEKAKKEDVNIEIEDEDDDEDEDEDEKEDDDEEEESESYKKKGKK